MNLFFQRSFFLLVVLAASTITLRATNEYFQEPHIRFGLRLDDTAVILSQTLQSDGTYLPATLPTGANTNVARRFGVSGLTQFEWGILRLSLDAKLIRLSSFFYTVAGVEKSSSTIYLTSFSVDPGAALKLGPLTLGADFHGVLTSDSNDLMMNTAFYDHRFDNSLSLKAYFDQKIFTLPLYLLGLATWNRNFLTSDNRYNLIIDGGLRFELNYYISMAVKYRAYLGVYDRLQYLTLWFNYQFTPEFGLGAIYSTCLPITGYHPMRQIQLMATFSPGKPSRKTVSHDEP